MRIAEIYRNGILTGTLTEDDEQNFIFKYDAVYFADESLPSISLTLSKKKRQYVSPFLFPFFSNMLAEGENREVQSRQLQIDSKDQMGLLLATAQSDTIGNITVKEITAQWKFQP